MDKKELMAAIDRVRRVMGRNADVMLICDYAQGELTRPVYELLPLPRPEATPASPARRGGVRPGAGRKAIGAAPMTATQRSKRHRATDKVWCAQWIDDAYSSIGAIRTK